MTRSEQAPPLPTFREPDVSHSKDVQERRATQPVIWGWRAGELLSLILFLLCAGCIGIAIWYGIQVEVQWAN